MQDSHPCVMPPLGFDLVRLFYSVIEPAQTDLI
jgi:hypothetical protein